MGKIQKFVQVLKLNGFDNFQDFELISATDNYIQVKNIKTNEEYMMHIEAKERYVIKDIKPEDVIAGDFHLVEDIETEDEELLTKLNLITEEVEELDPEEEIEEVEEVEEVEIKKPRGWALKKEFVDSEGNVYHKGILQPELKGTLPPTEF